MKAVGIDHSSFWFVSEGSSAGPCCAGGRHMDGAFTFKELMAFALSENSSQCFTFPIPLRHEVANSLISASGRILFQRLNPVIWYGWAINFSPMDRVPPPSNSCAIPVSDFALTPSRYWVITPLCPEIVTHRWCHFLSSKGVEVILWIQTNPWS